MSSVVGRLAGRIGRFRVRSWGIGDATMLVVVALMASSAYGQALTPRYWVASGTGLFGVSSNWSTTSGGAGGASVPGAPNEVNFDQSGTQIANFLGSSTVGRFSVERGTVTFQLNGNTLIANAGGGLGGNFGHASRLTIRNGHVNANAAGNDFRVNTNGVLVLEDSQLGTASLRPDLILGDNGSGTFLVEGRSSVFLTQLLAGGNAVNVGTAIFTGPFARLDVSGATSLGPGDLQITDGASAALAGLSIGPGSDVTVDGPGSGLVSSTLSVGTSASGRFNVINGASAQTTGAVSLGTSIGGLGNAAVTGAGSVWTQSSGAVIGSSSGGVVDVSEGGLVTTLGNATLGFTVTGQGAVTVTGQNSAWSVAGNLTVADAGAGALSVLDGGRVEVSGGLTVRATPSPATASLIIDGGELHVNGDAGLVNNGNLQHRDGLLRTRGVFQAQATAGPFTINGGGSDDLPTLELIGAAAVSNVTTLTVGLNHRGRLIVRNGRNWSVGANAINVGSGATGEGFLTVGPGGVFGTGGAGSLNIGGNGATAGGTGTVNVEAGGALDVGTLRLHPGGTINLNGGTLSLDVLGPIAGTFNWNAGTLRFDAVSQSLGAAEVAKFLGPDRTLRAGRTLASTQELGFAAHVAVDGGTVSASTVSLFSNAVLEIRAGSVEATGSILNSGSIVLNNPQALLRGTTLSNGALLRGTGIVRASLNNASAAQVQVTAGQRMQLEAASHTNSGLISVIGGEIDVTGAVTNSASTGLISARDAILRFRTGVLNFGSMAFSNGTVDVYGDISQATSGRITLSAGGVANFYDDVELAPGAPNVQATAIGSTISKAVFFGAYNGGVVGGGQGFIEGDHRPGNSPGAVPFHGDAFYGPFSTLHIELGGLTPGSGYDQLQIGGDLSLNGALSVSLFGGHLLESDQNYLIADVGGNRFGQFDGLGEGALVGNYSGRDLFITYAAGDGNDVALFTAPSFTADFDQDGDVDGDDLRNRWIPNFGTGPGADADKDGDSDGADFLAWQQQFGSGAGKPPANSVPEPTSFALATAIVIACLAHARRLFGE